MRCPTAHGLSSSWPTSSRSGYSANKDCTNAATFGVGRLARLDVLVIELGEDRTSVAGVLRRLALPDREVVAHSGCYAASATARAEARGRRPRSGSSRWAPAPARGGPESTECKP